MKLPGSRGIFGRRRGRRGFSLVEMLAALLVLSLLAVMIASAVSAAARMYHKSVYTSESETLSSTLNTALSDLLCYATDVTTGASAAEYSPVVSFRNPSYYGESIRLVQVSGNQAAAAATGSYLCFQAAGGTDRTYYNLLSSGTYTSLQICNFSLTYSESAEAFAVSYDIVTTDPMLQGARRTVACSFHSVALALGN